MENELETSPPVLQCPMCGKIFTKEKTKNRHRFYCRSKHSKGQQPPPKRSCVPCVRAKTRCDIQPGECVRCELKGLKCKWPPRAGDLQSTELNRSNQSQPELKTASTDLVQRIFSPPIPIRGDRLGIGSTSAFPLTDYNIGVSPSTRSQDMIGIPPALDSSCPAIDSPFSHFGEKQLDLEAISARLAEYGAPYSSFHFTGTSGPHFPHLPQQVSSRNALRAFQYRPLSNSSQRQSAGTLSRLLSSYPTTMLRQATFPPFIHPQCVPDIEGNPPPLKPLVKCVELAHAFKYRTLENSEMVWKAIRTEHERLWNERTKYNIWELLAALQSLLMYAIMRLVEGEKDYTDFDVLLLVSINLVCSQITDTVGGVILPEELSRTELPWKKWLFAESRRRTLSLYRVISIFMNLETAAPCRPISDFLDAPLPAVKTLWNAPDSVTWEKEYKHYLEQLGSSDLSTNGRLILLLAGAGANRRGVGWDDWFAGIDGLGVLVVIATSMLV